MLIVAVSAFAVWLPRRNMLAVMMTGGKVSDDHLRYRIDSTIRAWIPLSIWLRVLPWLEENSGLLSTDDQIQNVELPNKDVSLTAVTRLRNFHRLGGVSVYPRHLGPILDPLASIEKLHFVWIDSLQSDSDLGELKRLPQLEHLWLSKPPATGGGWKSLCDLPRLTHLGLDAAASCAALTEMGSIPSLERLTLQNCAIHDDDLRSLSDCIRLRFISTPGSSAVGATGLKHLACCTSLETLSMSCLSSDDELQVLTELRNLKRLDIRGPNLTPDGIDRLKLALPKCVIDAR